MIKPEEIIHGKRFGKYTIHQLDENLFGFSKGGGWFSSGKYRDLVSDYWWESDSQFISHCFSTREVVAKKLTYLTLP